MKSSGDGEKKKNSGCVTAIIIFIIISVFAKLDGLAGLISGLSIGLLYVILMSVHKKICLLNSEDGSLQSRAQNIQEKQKSMLFKKNRNQENMGEAEKVAASQKNSSIPTCEDIKLWYTQVKEESIKLRDQQPVWENGRLLDFVQVAGTRHHIPDDELNEKVNVNDKLILIREPENTHDSNAIAVLTQSGQHIGYVPQKRNLIISALLDSGTKLFARVFAKCIFEEKLYIAIEIFVRD